MDTREIPPSRAYRKRIGFEMWQSQLRKGSLDLAVLASLWAQPLDRPQICRRLEQIAGIVVVDGVIHPILRRLRNAHWIETQWLEVSIGHPRRLFGLTAGGRESTVELSRRWIVFANGMNSVVGTLAKSEPSIGTQSRVIIGRRVEGRHAGGWPELGVFEEPVRDVHRSDVM
jgi:PadR family transcriptional regulator, regulatory protein PadR